MACVVGRSVGHNWMMKKVQMLLLADKHNKESKAITVSLLAHTKNRASRLF
jgi:hypothetical protein